MKRNIKPLLAAFVLLAGTLFTSCKDDTEEVLTPIAEHAAGKWFLAKNYSQQDGKWVEEVNDTGRDQTLILRSDGTQIIAVTYWKDGQTNFTKRAWNANEEAGTLTLGPSEFQLFRLTATEMEIGHETALDPETGETMTGGYKWLLQRLDSSKMMMAEKIIGFWQFSKTYEKKDGQWVESSYGLPDEGTYDIREDGTMTAYSRKGESEHKAEATWSVNEEGEFRMTTKSEEGEENMSSVNVGIDKDGNLTLTYTGNFDPETGEVIQGEFMDVLVPAEKNK